jgi:hypothetical protein
MTTVTENLGFFCNMGALTSADRERHKQLLLRLEAARIEIRELPDGYSFRLRSESVSLAEAAEWISYESKCCPFFDFEILLERDNGSLWLKLRGKEGIKPFIRAEFGIR